MASIPIRETISTQLAEQNSGFAFVTITAPQDIRDPKKQKLIRKHARRRGNDTKRTCRKRLDLVFDLPETHQSFPLTAQLSNSSESLSSSDTVQSNEEAAKREFSIAKTSEQPFERVVHPSSLYFLRPLGAGRGINPFTSFPIKATPRILQLVNFMHRPKLDHNPMQQIWFTIGLSGKGAFQITLANAVTHLGRMNHFANGEDKESTMYYTESLAEIQKRLQNPKERLSDEVVGTVLGFACHDFLTGNLLRMKGHLDGLKRVLELRGGVATVNSDHILRIMIFWVDMNSSFLFDRVPLFPLPAHLLMSIPPFHEFRGLENIIRTWDNTFPELTDITEALKKTAELAHYINKNLSKTGFLKDEIFVTRAFSPIVHLLLSLPRYESILDFQDAPPELVARETLRLACLSMFTLLRERFHLPPVVNLEHHRKITGLLMRHSIDWFPFLNLRLWSLFVATLVAPDEKMAWYITEIQETIRQLGLGKWNFAVEIIKNIIWIDNIMIERANFIGMKLCASIV